MDPIIAYLKNGDLPKEKTEVLLLQLKAAHYVLYDDITKYITNNKKLVQELSTSHGCLCYKSCLHHQFSLEQAGADMIA